MFFVCNGLNNNIRHFFALSYSIFMREIISKINIILLVFLSLYTISAMAQVEVAFSPEHKQSETSTFAKGDINEDEKVDIADVIALINIIMKGGESEEDKFLEFNDQTLACISEEVTPNLVIKEGLVCQHEQTIRVLRDGNAIALIKLSEPVIISKAKEIEEWGYYQFPNIFRAAENDNLIIQWQMRVDSHLAYGLDSYGYLMSGDNGNTWELLDKSYFVKSRYRVEFRNGDILQVGDPTPKDIRNYSSFSEPVNKETILGRDFYLESDLPEDLRGVYLTLWSKHNESSTNFHASLDDVNLLRYAMDGVMPIVWWGNIKELRDGTLIAGIYPCFYRNSKGEVSPSAITFYKSKNRGCHWEFVGRIPYQIEGKDSESFVYDGGEGFAEPTFEILKDSTLFCVMRTGSESPMYKSFSNDMGQHWSVPEAFTPNGVMPNLLLLDNGVLVLASGRPGIQVRFNFDGDGGKWTEPIDLLQFKDEDGKFQTWWTCGYPSIISYDDHTFFIVYSDFRTKNEKGEYRKSVIFRKIEVIRRK